MLVTRGQQGLKTHAVLAIVRCNMRSPEMQAAGNKAKTLT
jgi:hypothetical protein